MILPSQDMKGDRKLALPRIRAAQRVGSGGGQVRAHQGTGVGHRFLTQWLCRHSHRTESSSGCHYHKLHCKGTKDSIPLHLHSLGMARNRQSMKASAQNLARNKGCPCWPPSTCIPLASASPSSHLLSTFALSLHRSEARAEEGISLESQTRKDH